MNRPTTLSSPVAAKDLRDPLLGGGPAAVGRGRHVAVHERVHQQGLLRQGELARELFPQPSLFGFQEREGVVGHQPHESLVGTMLITEEPGPVQWVEPGRGQARRVPDIVQRGGGDE